jgi:hypothetical protein
MLCVFAAAEQAHRAKLSVLKLSHDLRVILTARQHEDPGRVLACAAQLLAAVCRYNRCQQWHHHVDAAPCLLEAATLRGRIPQRSVLVASAGAALSS